MTSKKSRPPGYFITGTDTGIGKTEFTAWLVETLLKAGIRAVGFKPICCGDREDARIYWNLACRKIPLDLINPIHLPRPVAPLAQPCPSWNLIQKKIQRAIKNLRQDHNMEVILTEGAGGILCPISKQHTMRELAVLLGFPVLMVAPNRLGMLNHTLLTLEALRTSKLSCRGVVVNSMGKSLGKDPSCRTNFKLLKLLVREPLYSF